MYSNTIQVRSRYNLKHNDRGVASNTSHIFYKLRKMQIIKLLGAHHVRMRNEARRHGSEAVLSHIFGWDSIYAFKRDFVHGYCLAFDETNPCDFIVILKSMAPEGWVTLSTDMRITVWRDQDPAIVFVAAQHNIPAVADAPPGQQPFIGPMQPQQDQPMQE